MPLLGTVCAAELERSAATGRFEIVSRHKLLVIFVCILLSGCTKPYPVTLPSGKTISVLEIVTFDTSDHGPALSLRYRMPLDRRYSDIRDEVREVWDSFFINQVEKAGFKEAMIIAMQPPKGTIFQTSNGYPFRFIKSKEGKWSMD
jgi:hypothetical protein